MTERAPVAGAAVWVAVAGASLARLVRLSLIDVLLLLAPLVVVPLGLQLLPHRPRAVTLAVQLQPLAALLVMASLLLPAGPAAAGLALVWLLTAGLVGLSGLTLMLQRRSLAPEALAPAAAMGFLAVGALWLTVFRAGLRPLGFATQITELTAVHFHYAGFAATLMAALALGRLRDRSRARRACTVAAYLLVLGTPTVALAITLAFRPLALIGALLLATGVILTAAVTLFAIAPSVAPVSRLLLTTSAVSVLLPMILAVLYTARPVFGTPALGIEDMAATHGVINSILYATLGLTGWRLATWEHAPGADRG